MTPPASLDPPRPEEVRAAARRIAAHAVRTPLLAYGGDAGRAPGPILLKLENLQPTGSFKVRAAANALASADPAARSRGVGTASAGNMARALAWVARRLGLACTVVVPDAAPAAKVRPVEELGARVVSVPFDEWWHALEEGGHRAIEGMFVHPTASADVVAGDATIGLELAEELSEMAAVVVPFGGGGLACGIATAVKAMRPATRVYAAEVDSGAPLAASLAAGRPVAVEHRRSFVDGIGAPGMLPSLWPMASSVLDGSIVVGLEQVAEAVRRLAAHNRVVAEGAAAAALAACMTGQAGEGPVVAVISGGNIDAAVLATILRGDLP